MGLNLEPGQFFGNRYQIRSRLGEGGMGVVYRALDHQAQREVALKILSSSANERNVARFVREGQLTAALKHPGIVAVHTGGAVNGYPYLSYELIPHARTLDDVLPKLTVEGRVELLIRVMDAVAYAHAQGIVHRDLKPENVLVTPEGDPRVADFGLASGQDLDRLTKSGAMIGTPSYMAPEQIRGDRAEMGPQTDVWSLGVILYEALTGRLPFEGSSFLELAANVMREDPRPPRTFDRAVSPALDAVCLAALRREPADRYSDAGAFMKDLQAALRGERVSATSSSTFQRAFGSQGSAQRRRALLAVFSLPPSLVLGAGVWFATRPTSTPTPAPSASPAPTGADPAGEARAAWLALRDEANSVRKMDAIEAWLERYPEAEDREDALEAIRGLAERQRVLAIERVRAERLVFQDEDTLLVLGGHGIAAWDVGPGEGPREKPRWKVRHTSTVLVAHARCELGFLLSLRDGVHLLRQSGDGLLEPPLPGATALAYHSEGSLVAIGRGRGPIAVGRLVSEGERPRLEAPLPLEHELQYCQALAFSSDGRYLAAVVGRKQVGRALALWDLKTPGTDALRDLAITYDVERIGFVPGGLDLLVANDGGALHRYDLEGMRLRFSYESKVLKESVALAGSLAHIGRLTDWTFFPDRRLLTCSRGSNVVTDANTLTLWSPKGEELARKLPERGTYRSIAFSPSRRRIAVAHEETVEVRSAWLFR